ncbi:MAG: hypothetical protein ACHQ6U_08610 [Thermodesulfobacteriota bacterium]
MAGGQVVKELDSVDTSNQILLKQFPPKLRKLAKYLLESEQSMTVSDACRKLNLNRASIGTLIYKSKQKGNDFVQFVEEESKMLLHTNRIGVYKATINGAVSDTSTSHNDRKLYFQLAGDIKETPNINIGSLSLGININTIQLPESNAPKGVIDIEPSIPKGKG